MPINIYFLEISVINPIFYLFFFFQIKVEYPTVFNDTDENRQSQMFVANNYPCTPTYFTSEGIWNKRLFLTIQLS